MMSSKKLRFLFLLALAISLSACDSDDSHEAAVEKSIAVTTAIVETRDVQTRLFSIGRLAAKNAPVLASEINARVEEVLVDEGQSVEAGQVLVRLDTTTFELARREAQAAIEGLKVSIANEQRRVARYRDLKTTNAMSQERLDDAEAKLASDMAAKTAAEARLDIAEDRLARAEVVSPVDGVIERRFVSVGDFAKFGDPIAAVTDTNTLRAELPFPETVGHLLNPGQVIVLESLLAPGVKFEARIGQIRPEIGAVSRALTVIAEFENPGPWRPEATVSAAVVVDERPGALVVPYVALVERPAGMVVYVLDDRSEGRVRQQVVVPGERQNGYIEIVSGLEAGQVVVRDGASYLSGGALVQVRDADS
jgi:RND family efflux transporter MFP subunit